jgi:hypothetical protein
MEDMLRYLEEIVEPTVKDFEEHPTSRRHAFLACVAVFHGVDYLVYPKKSKRAKLRGKFRSQSPDFAIVDDVSHAFRHVEAGKKPNLKADDVISRPGGLSTTDGFSVFKVVEGAVVLSNDRNIVLLDTVKRAANFLSKQAKNNNYT